eukprot:gnl/MRDRNA2_/MRDRNA2_182925_c0_seq1.p1 gnl/MRDRNA2_/MRDRNA2_182925_c0~~gnl/MRDRNA2_/MRDRNA2_182925_c0_seq1.p1  ORF type:complete len:480 (+),score=93.29 gnl/MRDRNA2_/MRDRNA2_182925_c0_seq1:73-1512(+)
MLISCKNSDSSPTEVVNVADLCASLTSVVDGAVTRATDRLSHQLREQVDSLEHLVNKSVEHVHLVHLVIRESLDEASRMHCHQESNAVCVEPKATTQNSDEASSCTGKMGVVEPDATKENSIAVSSNPGEHEMPDFTMQTGREKNGGERPPTPKQEKVFKLATKSLKATGEYDQKVLGILQEWDRDGDGTVSVEEILKAAEQFKSERESHNQEREKHKKHKERKRMYRKGLSLISLLLFFSLAGNCLSTFYVLQLVKESKVTQNSGIMHTVSSHESPVATAGIKKHVHGINALSSMTKESLDDLEEVSFYHNGGYHRLLVSQVHRYEERIEVWGSPHGVVVVEGADVWYSPTGIARDQPEQCSAGNPQDQSLCKVMIDGKPPNNLQVEIMASRQLNPSGSARLLENYHRSLASAKTDSQGELKRSTNANYEEEEAAGEKENGSGSALGLVILVIACVIGAVWVCISCMSFDNILSKSRS